MEKGINFFETACALHMVLNKSMGWLRAFAHNHTWQVQLVDGRLLLLLLWVKTLHGNGIRGQVVVNLYKEIVELI
jgi:hypothetical protein